jgi:hypothetical protein
MKKITLFLFATCIALVGFGQANLSKSNHNAAFVTRAPMNADVQNLSTPTGKVFWSSGSSSTKVSYLTQNFDGTWLPTGWTQQILLTAKTWQRNNPSATPFTTVDPTNLYSALCPYSLPAETQNEWLKSPSITGTAAATALQLKFWIGFSYDYLPAGGLGNPGATLQCKISTNGGVNWTVLWDANTVPSFTGWGWREVPIDITSYKSAPFMLAWNIAGADGDLFAIDNISIAEPPSVDAGVTAVTAPVSSCTTLSSAENVVVTLKNYGTAALTGFPVSYKINNNTPVTVTYSGSIAAGATATYTFTGANAANLSVPGNYTIKAYTGAAGDGDPTNDTSTVYIYSGAATIPFAMGFETTDNLTGWTLTDVNADGFYWGIYTGAKYSHTGTGFAAYPYNTNGTTAADDWLFTKCLNLLSGNSYQLKFYYRALANIYPEAMNVNIGTTNTPAGMTTQLVDLPSISDTTYPSATWTFSVPSSGNYYIGFHCKSAADMAYLILDDVTVDLVTGVSSSENPQDISIYPNPASTMVTVIAPEKVTHLKVLDLLGNVIHEEDGLQNIVTLNTSDYSKGIYFVVVTTEKQTFTCKIQIIK